MRTVRQDAWSDAEDRLLAETVLSYIQSGRTQLEAFREISEKLSRTKAACGFRWNALIRKQYESEIEKAKRIRKGEQPIKNSIQQGFFIGKSKGAERLEQDDGFPVQKSVGEIIDTIISQLAYVKEQIPSLLQTATEDASSNEKLDRLKLEYDSLKTDYSRLKEDYDAFMTSIDRLRQNSLRETDNN